MAFTEYLGDFGRWDRRSPWWDPTNAYTPWTLDQGWVRLRDASTGQPVIAFTVERSFAKTWPDLPVSGPVLFDDDDYRRSLLLLPGHPESSARELHKINERPALDSPYDPWAVDHPEKPRDSFDQPWCCADPYSHMLKGGWFSAKPPEGYQGSSKPQ
ncbi:hypothetical protein D5S17_34680 [Pseudonocardiaceae bacterium YIM PH 21723]|nr:hypothetical protein D5S17_34680 [Pseudonocardiaceae bacterium YIM PH 21723]